MNLFMRYRPVKANELINKDGETIEEWFYNLLLSAKMDGGEANKLTDFIADYQLHESLINFYGVADLFDVPCYICREAQATTIDAAGYLCDSCFAEVQEPEDFDPDGNRENDDVPF